MKATCQKILAGFICAVIFTSSNMRIYANADAVPEYGLFSVESPSLFVDPYVNSCPPQKHEHNYVQEYKGKKFESDICAECGYMRIHSVDGVQYFITAEDNTDSHVMPAEAESVVDVFEDQGTELRVVGRIRNQYNNLWLQLSDGSFIWSGDTAFDFQKTANGALADIIMGIYGFNVTHTCETQEICYEAGFLSAFYDLFAPGMKYDLKQDSHLGNNKNSKYRLYIDGSVQSTKYTGEELGNIFYGYMTSMWGLSYNDALFYAGIGASDNRLSCLLHPNEAVYYCDSPDDRPYIKLGYDYFNLETWEDN